VLFFNPKSGGGKAEQFSLPKEARARGIEPIELVLGQDLETLVRDAIANGADGLAMAGGDGSQAVVAAIAAEHDLPYACVPAGTRNHFALDLGVDRNDVVGALDAFVNGGERRVDLAEVNGRVFVNNVSLGIYAEAVQQSGYRDAKLRTMLDTVPTMLGPQGAGLDLRWTDPDGNEHTSGAVILVSNNRYRLGRTIGSGTRPRLDEGLLGVAVMGSPSEDESKRQRWREWTAPDFEVDSEGLIATGIDGEAAKLESPIRFRIRAGVLRVRVARQHPGASPSAALPDGLKNSALTLARIAIGRDSPGTRETGSSFTNATNTKEN
jgi:diacylglycerol kinase family enzyme